jgi:hypothetical protein
MPKISDRQDYLPDELAIPVNEQDDSGGGTRGIRRHSKLDGAMFRGKFSRNAVALR